MYFLFGTEAVYWIFQLNLSKNMYLFIWNRGSILKIFNYTFKQKHVPFYLEQRQYIEDFQLNLNKKHVHTFSFGTDAVYLGFSTKF